MTAHHETDSEAGAPKRIGLLDVVIRVAGILLVLQLGFIVFLAAGGGFNPPDNALQGLVPTALFLAFVDGIAIAAAIKVAAKGPDEPSP